MNRSTREAKGYSKNGGVTRVLPVYIDEETYLTLKAQAIENGRTMSNQALQHLKKGVMVAHAEKQAAHVSL